MKKKGMLKQVFALGLALLLVVTCVLGHTSLSALAATEISGGIMQPHPVNGGSSTGIYFTLAENDALYKSDWTLEYMPTSADAIKIVRGGVTYNTANTGAGTLVKYSTTEYYLKFDAWMNSNHPLQDGDIVIVNGAFTKDNYTITIDTTYILYSEGAFTFSTTMPGEDKEITAGVMSRDTANPSPNLENGGFYFTMEANADIPYGGDWDVRYIPTTADAIKRIRNGETTNVGNTGGETLVKYSETAWYVEGWAIGTHNDKWQAGDILVVDGIFANASNGVEFTIEKTYILYDGTSLKFSQVWPSAIELGNMQADAEHLTPNADGGFYFTLAANELVPYDGWDVKYYPMNAGTIQRIRDGETVDVTNTAATTLIKYSETGWFMEGWATKASPADATGGLTVDGDIFVVEGAFNGAADGSGITFHISRTYIYYKNGELTFSTEMPEEDIVIEAGYMSQDANHPAPNAENGGFYFTMEPNASIPYGDWDVRYIPTTADAIKRIRNGETTNVGNTGGETLVKYSETEWYVEGWTIGTHNDPWKDGDILIVDGTFTNASNGISFTVAPTYILYYDGILTFSTTMPEIPSEPSIILAGSMKEHMEGWKGGSFYFTMDENVNIPYNSDWSVRYVPVNSGTIQLIRDGVTTDVTNIEAETIVKYGAQDWFIESWAIGGGLTGNGDILVVEGDFTGQGITFTINKTYIMYYNGEVTFSTTMPEIPKEPENIKAGQMISHDKGYDSGGFYFKMKANSEIPYNSDWSVRYMPAESGVIKLIRNGVTTDVTNTQAETIVKYGAEDWHMEAWATGGGLTKDGDILVVEGDFVGHGVTFTIDKTYIMYYDGLLTFSSTMPEIPTKPERIDAGKMTSHVKGYDGGGFYFTMKANSKIPYNSDWTVRYKPLETGTILRIRNGVTTDVTNTDAETLVKYGATDWYIEDWATDGGLVEDGDILVIEGAFAGNGIVFNVDKTYVKYSMGLLFFGDNLSTLNKEVEIISAGSMTEHPNGYSAGAFYFTLPENEDIPYNSDWSVRYKPLKVGTIMRLRDGVTTDVTNTEAETIVKYGAADWYMEAWATDGGLTQEGDVFIVEGQFVGSGVILSVEKSYVLYSGGNVSFYTEDEWNALAEQEEDEEEAETEVETDTKKPVYYKKTVLKPWVIPVFASLAGCLVVAGIVILVVLKKRKRK